MAGVHYGVSVELHDDDYSIHFRDAMFLPDNYSVRELITYLEDVFECVVVSFTFNNLNEHRIYQESELNLNASASDMSIPNSGFEVLVRRFEQEIDFTNPTDLKQFKNVFRIMPYNSERKSKITELRLNVSRATVAYRIEERNGNSRRAVRNATDALSNASREFELFLDQYDLYLAFIEVNQSRLIVKTFVSNNATLNRPTDITVDDEGNLFVCNHAHQIIKITQAGIISLFAGTGERGHKNGSAMEATFNSPEALCFHKGNLYIADGRNHSIRILTPDNQVQTFVQFEEEYYPDDIWVMDDNTLGVWNEDELFTVKLDGTVAHVETGNNEYERYQHRGTVDARGNEYYVGVEEETLKIRKRDGTVEEFGTPKQAGERLYDGPLELLRYTPRMIDGFVYDKLTHRVYFYDDNSIRMITSIAEIFKDISVERALVERKPALLARSRYWAQRMRRGAPVEPVDAVELGGGAAHAAVAEAAVAVPVTAVAGAGAGAAVPAVPAVPVTAVAAEEPVVPNNNSMSRNAELLSLVARHANSSSSNQVLLNMLPPAVNNATTRNRRKRSQRVVNRKTRKQRK